MTDAFQVLFSGPLCIQEALGGAGVKTAALGQAIFVAFLMAPRWKSLSIVGRIFTIVILWIASTVAIQVLSYAIQK